MGGTIHGLVDCVIYSQLASNNTQAMFISIYRFFNEVMVPAGYATFVAKQYGSLGTGMDYFDSATPAGNNAFFVVRMNASTQRPGGGQMGAYYLLFQWSTTGTFGNAPGNPGKLSGFTGPGVGYVLAFREDGGSPWAGSTNNDGADTKAATVWTAGGSTLHILDRSCGPGGTYAVNKENILYMTGGTVGNSLRIHLIGDEDSIVILTDNNNAGAYGAQYMGLYTVATGVVCSYPMVVASTILPLIRNQTYGSLTGNTGYEGALVTSDTDGNNDSAFQLDYYNDNIMTTAHQPSHQSDLPIYDVADLLLYAYDVAGGWYGLCGRIPSGWVGNTYKAGRELYSSPSETAIFGADETAGVRQVYLWPAGQQPRCVQLRAGVPF